MRNSHLQIFYKIDVLKNVTQLTGKYLSWSHILIKLQVSRPETSLKRDSSTVIFLWILHNFSKNLIYGTALSNCSCWFLRSNQGFIHWLTFFCFFSSFPFIIDNCNGNSSRKAIKMKIFFLLFTIIYANLTWMLLQQFRLVNNLPTHIRKNTDFPW